MFYYNPDLVFDALIATHEILVADYCFNIFQFEMWQLKCSVQNCVLIFSPIRPILTVFDCAYMQKQNCIWMEHIYTSTHTYLRVEIVSAVLPGQWLKVVHWAFLLYYSLGLVPHLIYWQKYFLQRWTSFLECFPASYSLSGSS